MPRPASSVQLQCLLCTLGRALLEQPGQRVSSLKRGMALVVQQQRQQLQQQSQQAPQLAVAAGKRTMNAVGMTAMGFFTSAATRSRQARQCCLQLHGWRHAR
jgi:hypothetical protein